MFEQVFKNVDDILHKDAGCGSELDYVEQTSWIIFLKYLEDIEKDRQTAALLSGSAYKPIIEEKFKWHNWAVPKTADGKIDHHKAQNGDDLKDFVDGQLFPYLKRFKSEATSADTIEYKIGEIFSELKNKIQTGYSLREILNLIDTLRFKSKEEKHEMSHLYEDKIKNMGNAGRNGGEYYTPRSLIKTIVKVVEPKIGDKIYDGAVGSAGFLAEAFEYLKTSKDLTTRDMEILQKSTFYGREKKSLAYIIGTMNMILHGVEAPNIVHTNTLAENLADIQDKDRYDIVLANPPFGGKEHTQIQQNFPIRTGETAYLFLQHFIKIMKAGGKAGVVIKNTFLSNDDAASVALRRELLKNCDLHTILDMPNGTFAGAGVKTVVLFFEKGRPTKNIWFYQLNLTRNLGKTNALNEADLSDFISLQKLKTRSSNSWSIDVKDINQETFDLKVLNPNREKHTSHRPVDEIIEDIISSDVSLAGTLNNIKLLNYAEEIEWAEKRLGDICEIELGKTPYRANKKFWDVDKKTSNVWLSIADLLNVDGNVVSDSKEYLSDSGAKISKVVEKGTLLVSFKLTLGRLAFAGRDLYTNEAIAALAIKNESEISKEYLFYYLQFFDWESASEGDMKVKGKTLNKQKLKNILISYPKSLQKQKAITEKLAKLDIEKKELIQTYKKNLLAVEELSKSVYSLTFKNN